MNTLSDSNKIWTHNDLICKRTLNHLPKLESGCELESRCCHLIFRYHDIVLSKEFLDIQATTECSFTVKRVRDMIITYSRYNVFLRKRLEMNFPT